MHPSESVTSPPANRIGTDVASRRRRRPLTWLIGGGTEGNEELTSKSGAILIVLFAVLGITILQIRQLIWLHLFLGLLLLGPAALKLASTGYRFVRYYTGDAPYREKGPPELAWRAMGPIVVSSMIAVFASGVVLLFEGPRNRALPLLIHKASFVVWLVFMAFHVLGRLPRLGRALRGSDVPRELSGAPSGAPRRWSALSGALVGGLVLEPVLVPHFGLWAAPGAFPHHDHLH